LSSLSLNRIATALPVERYQWAFFINQTKKKKNETGKKDREKVRQFVFNAKNID
jgi:hypothetical protein